MVSWRPRTAALAVAVLVLAGAPGCAGQAPPIPEPPAGPPDLASPLLAYHGMILDHRLVPIPLTAENAERLLDRFTGEVAAAAPPEVAGPYRERVSGAAPLVEASPELRLAARIRLAHWLLTQPSGPEAGRSPDLLRVVATWARGLPGPATTPTELARLDAVGPELMAPPRERKPPPPPPTYRQRCGDASIPLPPDWGAPDWKRQGVLDPAHTFAGDPGQVTEVWAYADPAVPGTCVALPRRNAASGEIALLGMICQSATTGNACFWDNIDRKTGARMGGAASAAYKIEDVQDGDLLSENCTNCHRGPNAFIISPGTTLALRGYVTKAPVRYTPISTQGTWGNPGPQIAKGVRPCATCHEIPEFGENDNAGPALGSAYCRILQKVVDTTMPNLRNPAGWAAPKAGFKAHVDLFRVACDGPP